MSTVRRFIDKYRVGSTITLLFLAFIWLIPTIGLLITSLREKTEAQTSGWWTVFTKITEQNWTTIAYRDVFAGGELSSSFIASLAVTIPASAAVSSQEFENANSFSNPLNTSKACNASSLVGLSIQLYFFGSKSP